MSHFDKTVERETGQRVAHFNRGQIVVVEGFPSQGLPMAKGSFLAYRTTTAGELRGARFFKGLTTLGFSPDVQHSFNPFSVKTLGESTLGFVNPTYLPSLTPDSQLRKLVAQATNNDILLLESQIAALYKTNMNEKVISILDALTDNRQNLTPPITMEQLALLVGSGRPSVVRALQDSTNIRFSGDKIRQYEFMNSNRENIHPITHGYTAAQLCLWIEAITERVPVEERLASILTLWTSGGTQSTDFIDYTDLASTIKSSRPPINGLMKKWKDKGFIVHEGSPKRKRRFQITELGMRAFDRIRDGVSTSALDCLND